MVVAPFDRLRTGFDPCAELVEASGRWFDTSPCADILLVPTNFPFGSDKLSVRGEVSNHEQRNA